MAITSEERTALNAADLKYVCDLIRERSAIMLDESKTYLIQARLMPLARVGKFETLTDFVRHLRATPSSSPLLDEVVDAMTTNETSFFRDLHPFDALKNTVLPQMIDARKSKRVLNIWCGASSSGQEPYTIAMSIREHFPELLDWKLDFWATDVSPSMLKRCKEGVFSQIEVNRGLPVNFMIKYFEQQDGAWIIKEEVRQMVNFRSLNLIQPWPLMPKFDIVFLRNVLIYFDLDTKNTILGNIRKGLADDGYLFLGTAESMVGITDAFAYETCGKTMVYRPT